MPTQWCCPPADIAIIIEGDGISNFPSSGGPQPLPYSWLPDGNYLTTVNGDIVNQDGTVVVLHGIAWYGFGDPNVAMVEGLSAGTDSQIAEFTTVVQRMKVLLVPSLPTLSLLTSCQICVQKPTAAYIHK